MKNLLVASITQLIVLCCSIAWTLLGVLAGFGWVGVIVLLALWTCNRLLEKYRQRFIELEPGTFVEADITRSLGTRTERTDPDTYEFGSEQHRAKMHAELDSMLTRQIEAAKQDGAQLVGCKMHIEGLAHKREVEL